MNVVPPGAKLADTPSDLAFAPGRALKRAYHVARSLSDRMLHPWRHLAACRRLVNARPARGILVVCHGNICRSPYLQAVLQRRLPGVAVTSAGFVGSGRSVPPISITVSAERGLDLSRHRSQPITQSKVSGVDLVIVMDPGQAVEVARRFRFNRERILIAGDLDPKFDGSREIRDPWNQSIEMFKSSFDRLDRCATTVAGVLSST